jgi:PAS domain-containing protein
MTAGAFTSDPELLGAILDAVPSMLLVVDGDVRIHMLNAQASEGLGLRLQEVRNRRTGEVLHCIHAAFAEEGCGSGAFCQDCAIRNAVILAMQGCATLRQSIGMVLLDGETRRELHLVVSASPVQGGGGSYAVLTVENVSDLLQLRHLLPICMHCHRIRDEQGAWHPIADYLTRQLDVEFSHGICPGCLEAHYPLLKHLGKEQR